MNSKKIVVLLFMLIVYVNYVMHFKEDVSKMQRQIVAIESRTVKEQRLTKEKKAYKDVNTTKSYSGLFYNGSEASYSQNMGLFQQDVESAAKEAHCTVSNIQWQEIAVADKSWYDLLSLRVTTECQPKALLTFLDNTRKDSKLIVFNQLMLNKVRRKPLLRMNATLFAYRSKKNEK